MSCLPGFIWSRKNIHLPLETGGIRDAEEVICKFWGNHFRYRIVDYDILCNRKCNWTFGNKQKQRSFWWNILYLLCINHFRGWKLPLQAIWTWGDWPFGKIASEKGTGNIKCVCNISVGLHLWADIYPGDRILYSGMDQKKSNPSSSLFYYRICTGAWLFLYDNPFTVLFKECY